MKDRLKQPICNDIGKLPPQDIELETVVLGALLIDNDAINLVVEILRPNYFYSNAHGIIYMAIQELHKRNAPIDILTVKNELSKTNQLTEVGGPAYLAKLTSKIASSVHVEMHTRIIQQKFVLRELIRISNETANNAYDEDIDMDDQLIMLTKSIEQIENCLSLNSNETDLHSSIQSSIINLQKRIENKGQLSGLQTFSVDLDKNTNGWQPADLIILAARPSVGKSSIMIENVKKLKHSGKNILLFSLEVTQTRIIDTLIIKESGINADNYRKGRIDEIELGEILNASYKVEDYKLTIDDRAGITLLQVKRKARKLKRQGKCDIIFIDHLQLMGVKNTNRNNELGEITSGLKVLAKELNIPIVLLSQLNREVEKRKDKKPMLADLRDSGNIEQDADVIVFLYRPCPDATDETQFILGVIVAKNRFGALGEYGMKHNDSRTKFYDDYSGEIPANVNFSDTPY